MAFPGVGLPVLRRSDIHVPGVPWPEPGRAFPQGRVRYTDHVGQHLCPAHEQHEHGVGYSAINRGDLRGFRIWVLSTCLLGATFLAFQTFEFYDFANHKEACTPESQVQACLDGEHEYDHGLTPRTNLFGTTFFTLTGLHGAHVTVGVIWLLSIFGYSIWGGPKARRILTDRQALSVDLAALYWHFVDIVWIVIFAAVYLIGVGVT